MPTINTGIAHKKPGIGQVGAGVVKAPKACFETALVAFGLLDNDGRAMTLAETLRLLDPLLAYVRARRLPLTAAGSDAPRDARRAHV